MPESAALRRLAAALDGPTDADLLARFAADRDAGSFELLVWRHAGLVLRVCRSVLRDHHAAEDAAQAVFLALARQAAQVGRTGSATGWLFRVARRVAGRAARRWARHRSEPGVELDRLPATGTPEHDPDRDRLLHDEVARLPERYRLPVLMCFFEGLSHAEAARRLGWPVGTVAGRLARAKAILARRLSARGVGLTGLVLPLIGGDFVAATARAAVGFARRGSPEVSRVVLELAKSEGRVMAATTTVRWVGLLAVCGGLTLGLAWAADPPAQQPPPAAAAPPAKAEPAPARPPKAVVAKAFAIAPVTTDLHRRLLWQGNEGLAAVVFVDGLAVVPDEKSLDPEVLDPVALCKALETYRPAGERAVYFQACYRQGRPVNPLGREFLGCALEGIGRRAGFGRATAHEHYSFVDWAEWVAALRDEKGSGAEEKAVGDERVKAYPVRTPLSRMLTGSADAVVHVRPALDPTRDEWVPAEVEKSVRAAIVALKPSKGQKVNFYFNLPRRRDDRTQDRVRELSRRWAEEHGLELGSFSY